MPKKKKHRIRNFLFGSTAAMLTTYAISEIRLAAHRYEIKDTRYETEHYVLDRQVEMEAGLSSVKQRSYTFTITGKEKQDNLGLVQLLMGQEADSYYGGHIRFKADTLDLAARKEISEAMIKMASNHMMQKLYFTCEPKDKEMKEFYTSLGAVLKKQLKVPENSPYYVKKHDKLCQYELILLDKETQEKINGFGKKAEEDEDKKDKA